MATQTTQETQLGQLLACKKKCNYIGKNFDKFDDLLLGIFKNIPKDFKQKIDKILTRRVIATKEESAFFSADKKIPRPQPNVKNTNSKPSIYQNAFEANNDPSPSPSPLLPTKLLPPLPVQAYKSQLSELKRSQFVAQHGGKVINKQSLHLLRNLAKARRIPYQGISRTKLVEMLKTCKYKPSY